MISRAVARFWDLLTEFCVLEMPHLSLGKAMWLLLTPSLPGTTLGQLFALCLNVASLGFVFAFCLHLFH